MFTAWILLMLNSLFFTLRLSGGGSGSFPRPLKAEEERMYLERMAQGDLEARNILIEHNLRLVAHIMKKYYTPNGDQDDLISIGTIGLIKGISTFKPDKNVRLATYASRCIENEILMHFRAQRKLQGEVSLSDSIDGDGDGNSLSLMDTISVDDNMLEELDARDSCAKVRRCVKRCLDEREAMIITLRYGLNFRFDGIPQGPFGKNLRDFITVQQFIQPIRATGDKMLRHQRVGGIQSHHRKHFAHRLASISSPAPVSMSHPLPNMRFINFFMSAADRTSKDTAAGTGCGKYS